MLEVKYGTDHYHLQEQMISWCKENIGPGGWSFNEPTPDWKWSIKCTFGRTIFMFVDRESFYKFREQWDHK